MDHIQRYFNEIAVNYFAEVITNKYHADKQPVAILDICCGYAYATMSLREKLINNSVEIARIVGYDISDDMINFAKSQSSLYPEVEFRKKNIEKDFNDVAQFDLVLCLFGLHWMNELEVTAGKTNKALKPNGLFLTFSPIEIPDLFDYRKAFVNNSRWTKAIAEKAREIHPFQYEKNNIESHSRSNSPTFMKKERRPSLAIPINNTEASCTAVCSKSII